MTDRPAGKKPEEEPEMSRQVDVKAERKMKAKRDDVRTVWAGIGMMGLIGWSVAIPTLLGAALGLWLDRNYPGSFSWTLTMLIAGLFIGCLNAWHWVSKENQEMREEQEDNNE
jgi:ATP synthase protein I